jgi:tRNA (mo5U34)-methyltransferase
MDVDELRREVGKIGWWHRIDLGRGVVTPGANDSPTKLARLALPADLRGRTVLDIGAWDGFYSFEAERRGARRVVAVDYYGWSEGKVSNAGFQLARRAIESKVEHLERDVMQLSAEELGTFDLVLFLGVLYHLRDPLAALERVHRVTGAQLILETHVELRGRRPLMVFYPDAQLSQDPTNWWGPNPAAVKEMLRTVGFRRVEEVSRDAPLTRLRRALKVVARRHAPFLQTFRQGRAVFHAWR